MGTSESGSPKAADNDLVEAGKQGTVILGTDGTNYQVIKTNADGELVTSGSGGTSQVTGTLAHQDPLGADDLAIRIAGMDETQTNQFDITATPDGNKICLDVNVARVDGANFAVDTELPTAATLADGAGNPIAPMVGANLQGFNGTTWDRLRSDTTNGLDVDVTRVSGDVTVVQSTASNLKNQTEGTTAAGGTPPNPVYIGMRELVGGALKAPHVFESGGVAYQLNLIPDTDLNFLNYATDGSMNCRAGSADGTLANSVYQNVDAARNTKVVTTTSSTSTRTQVADTASDTQLIAANTARKKVIIYNDSTAALYIGFGATAVTTSNYTAIIYPNGYFEDTYSLDQIRGIWASDPNTGGAKITELTA